MNQFKKWNIIGTIFTLIIGTLLHFLYEWTGGSLTAILGAVNESILEHLKLVFWPVICFSWIEYKCYHPKPKGFLPIRVLSALLAMLFIVISFYTYTGILGFMIPWLNILIFIIATISAYIFSYYRFKQPKKCYTTPFATFLSVIILVGMIVCFIVFTHHPPQLNLFLDPVTQSYWIS